MTSTTVLIEEFSKCRINFGIDYGCLSISDIMVALGVVAAFMLVLGVIMLKYGASHNAPNQNHTQPLNKESQDVGKELSAGSCSKNNTNKPVEGTTGKRRNVK